MKDRGRLQRNRRSTGGNRCRTRPWWRRAVWRLWRRSTGCSVSDCCVDDDDRSVRAVSDGEWVALAVHCRPHARCRSSRSDLVRLTTSRCAPYRRRSSTIHVAWRVRNARTCDARRSAMSQRCLRLTRAQFQSHPCWVDLIELHVRQDDYLAVSATGHGQWRLSAAVVTVLRVVVLPRLWHGCCSRFPPHPTLYFRPRLSCCWAVYAAFLHYCSRSNGCCCCRQPLRRRSARFPVLIDAEWRRISCRRERPWQPAVRSSWRAPCRSWVLYCAHTPCHKHLRELIKCTPQTCIFTRATTKFNSNTISASKQQYMTLSIDDC